MKISSLKSSFSNPLAKNSLIMFVGTMVMNFGAYLYQVVVIRILGPEKYSEFAALISLLFILIVPSSVLQLVLTKYFSRYKANGEIGEARTLFVMSLKWVGIVCLFGLVVYIPFIPLLQRNLHIASYESFVYLYFVVSGSFFVTVFTGLMNGYQQFFTGSLNAILLTIFRIISGVILAPISVAATILGNGFANMFSMVMYIFSSRFMFSQPPKKILIKKEDIVKFAIPTLLATLGMTAFFNIDVIFVKHFFEASQAGIYASLTVFGKIIFFAASPVILVIFPMIVEKKEQNKDFNSLFLFGLIAVTLCCFAIVAMYAFFAPFVTQMLFGEKFSTAAPYLGFYGLFMAFVTIANYLMTVCLAVNKTKAGILVLIASIIESIAIILFHTSIFQVITSITIVAGVLAAVLLLYYAHARRVS